MAWVKIPSEHHPIFREALPRGATTKNMFGGVAAFVNDQMFGGLFARSAIVKLSAADQKTALALDGATPFDPMGNGRIMRDTVLLPDSVMDEPHELRDWLRRAYDHVATLPPKPKKRATKPAAAKPKPKAKRPAPTAPKRKRATKR
jgi:TfoX/Sxy family transcriptional regulator of competence genes